MPSQSVKVDCAVPNGVGAAVKLSSFLPAPYASTPFAFTGYVTAIGAGTVTLVTQIGTGTLINTQCEFYEDVDLNQISVYGSVGGLVLCIGGSH